MTKKNSFQLFIISLILIGGITSAKRAPDPVVQFSEAFEDKLVGTIETMVDYPQIKKRQFFLVDQEGRIAWEFLQTEGVLENDFSFDIPQSVNGGLYDFHIIWLDEYQQQIVATKALVENIRPTNNLVFEVSMSRAGSVNVEWQGNVDTNAKLMFELRENSYWGPVIFSQGTIAEPVRAGAPKIFTTEFVLPSAPESYLALAQVVDASGEPLSPKYQQRFLVLGDFAEITGVLPRPGTDLGNAEELQFSGSLIAPNEQGLVLTIKESSGLFSEELVLGSPARRRQIFFEKTLPLSDSEKSDIEIQVSVKNSDGNILESKQYAYKKTPVVSEPVPVAEPEFSIPLWAYLIAGFGLVSITVLFFVIKRRNRPVV